MTDEEIIRAVARDLDEGMKPLDDSRRVMLIQQRYGVGYRRALDILHEAKALRRAWIAARQTGTKSLF